MATDSTPLGLDQWLPGFVDSETRPEMVEHWVDRTTTAIVNEVPESGRVEGLTEQIRDTVREHWLAFLAQFTQPTVRFDLVPRGQQLAADLARTQLPLEVLIRFYRVAQQTTWVYVTEVVNALPGETFDHAEVLIYFWDRAGAWFDESITASIDIFQAERNRALAGESVRRLETVRAVLEGAANDARDISASLGGYPISVHHTALVTSAGTAERLAEVEHLVADIARTAGSGHPILVRPGGPILWAWFATRDVPDLTAIVETASASTVQGLRMGIGAPTAGVRGFRRTHEQADQARRLAVAGGGDAIVCFPDVELMVLLGCGPEVDEFVVRTLADLARDDETAERIRETVSAFLDGGGNADEAARRLSVHRNTVRYRLGQAEELLGQPISRTSAELSIALRHRRTFHHDGSLTGPR